MTDIEILAELEERLRGATIECQDKRTRTPRLERNYDFYASIQYLLRRLIKIEKENKELRR